MAISVLPRGRIEDEVINRIFSNIPAGEFYLKAQYVLPILGGTGRTPFIVSGTRGRIVKVLLNNNLHSRIGLISGEETVWLNLSPPPVINEVTVIDEFDESSASLSAVTTNYASVITGAAKTYFKEIWIPYLYQYWSLTSEWTARHVEYKFKYHNRWPNTQSMRVLAARLAARAAYQDQPSSMGVRSSIGALCGSEPVVKPISNQRDTFDIGLTPLLPIQADYNGHEFSVWYPDVCSAREQAFLQYASNLSQIYLIKDHIEGYTTIEWQGRTIHVRQQSFDSVQGCNLRGVFDLIGTLDYWQGYIDLMVESDVFQSFYGFGPDLVVTRTLGGGRTFDLGISLDQTNTFDTNDYFSEKWDRLDVIPPDIGQPLDATVKRAKAEGELTSEDPFGSSWEYTAISASANTATTITNTLHGGAPPEFEA